MLKKFYFLIITTICLGFSCFSGAEVSKDFSNLSNGPDRYFRLFEGSDLGSQVFYFEKNLPPYLSYLLNSTTYQTLEEPIALPVHPEGELLTSYHVLKQNGSHVVWLIFDVFDTALNIEEDIQKQLNSSPWQLNGGQSSNVFSVVSFRNTKTPSITGLATIQSLPPTLKIDMEILRDSELVLVEFPRGSIIPFLSFVYEEEGSRVVITDSGYHSIFNEGDVIESIEGNIIESIDDLSKVMANLDKIANAKSSIMYRLNIDSDIEFNVNAVGKSLSRPIPKKFPARFLFLEDAVVTELNWSIDERTASFQSSLKSGKAISVITDLYRNLLNTQGWELVDDMSQGSSILLGFQNTTLGYSGVLSIERDVEMEEFTIISIRIENSN